LKIDAETSHLLRNLLALWRWSRATWRRRAAMVAVCVLSFMSATPAHRVVDISALIYHRPAPTSPPSYTTVNDLQRFATSSDFDAAVADDDSDVESVPLPSQQRRGLKIWTQIRSA
jgi:hypothetical protein